MNSLELAPSSTYILNKEPNRPNIRYAVKYVDNKTDPAKVFAFWISNIKEHRHKAPRTIIFCQTKVQCASLFQLFSAELGKQMFLDGIKSPKNRLVEMFHALTPASVKEHIIKEMTSSDSCLCILVCTMAFGMGVDCKDLNCSIHLGPSKNIEMYLQESGRIGRDGKPSTSLVFYKFLLLATSDNTIRGYCNSTTCRRNYLSSIFPKSGEKSAVKGCTCCDKCTGECDCASVNCQKWLDFEEVKDTIPAAVVRKVTSSQRKEVNNKLWLYGEMLLQKYNDLKPVEFPNLFIEFGSNQVQQVIENLEEIFSIEDVYKNVEIWRKEHANNII